MDVIISAAAGEEIFWLINGNGTGRQRAPGRIAMFAIGHHLFVSDSGNTIKRYQAEVLGHGGVEVTSPSRVSKNNAGIPSNAQPRQADADKWRLIARCRNTIDDTVFIILYAGVTTNGDKSATAYSGFMPCHAIKVFSDAGIYFATVDSVTEYNDRDKVAAIALTSTAGVATGDNAVSFIINRRIANARIKRSIEGQHKDDNGSGRV